MAKNTNKASAQTTINAVATVATVATVAPWKPSDVTAEFAARNLAAMAYAYQLDNRAHYDDVLLGIAAVYHIEPQAIDDAMRTIGYEPPAGKNSDRRRSKAIESATVLAIRAECDAKREEDAAKAIEKANKALLVAEATPVQRAPSAATAAAAAKPATQPYTAPTAAPARAAGIADSVQHTMDTGKPVSAPLADKAKSATLLKAVNARIAEIDGLEDAATVKAWIRDNEKHFTREDFRAAAERFNLEIEALKARAVPTALPPSKASAPRASEASAMPPARKPAVLPEKAKAKRRN